jgi:hypothetical protein
MLSVFWKIKDAEGQKNTKSWYCVHFTLVLQVTQNAQQVNKFSKI